MKNALGFLLTSLAAAGTLLVVVLVFGPGKDSITMQSYERLREGMTLAETEGLIGNPTRQVNWTAADGTACRGCFYENLSATTDDEIASITLQFVRQSGDNPERWILQSKCFVKTTQIPDFWSRLENAGLRAAFRTGLKQAPVTEAKQIEKP
jgi:hypothetical protein